MEYPKVYKNSLADAQARGEVMLFQQSHRDNISCKVAIEAAIREHFNGVCLDTACLKGVLETYGAERVKLVLANTIQQKHYDGRFSPENKQWAKQVPVPGSRVQGRDILQDYVAESHPAVLNGFVDLARRGQEERKLSVREQLAEKGMEKPKAAPKNRCREVR